MLFVIVLVPSKWNILVTPITDGGTCKKLLFSRYENVVDAPLIDVVAVVVVIPAVLSVPGFALPLAISYCIT